MEKAELMGLEDRGQWMSFAFHMDVVVACKLTSLEEDSLVYNCTTIFTEHGDTYIIDTPYKTFQKMFVEHHSEVSPTEGENTNEGDLDF
jgi:hypothetical protein